MTPASEKLPGIGEVIDYSEIESSEEALVGEAEQDWEPPRHVYFGPKGPRGKMLPELEYVHKDYPRTMYGRIDGRVTARRANDEIDEKQLAAEGFKRGLLELGVITCPSQADILAAKDKLREGKKK